MTRLSLALAALPMMLAATWSAPVSAFPLQSGALIAATSTIDLRTDVAARSKARPSHNVNRNRNVNSNRNVNRSRNINRNVNVNVNRRVVVRPVRPWVRRPYFGTVVAGVALGTIVAATAVPAAPAPNLCWYWASTAHTQGYWDYCTPPQ